MLLFKPLFVYSYATGTSWVSQHENVCDICNSDNLEYQFKCQVVVYSMAEIAGGEDDTRG